MTPMDAARAALKEVFGYDDFRPGQEDAVAAVLRGRDVMAVMPTGAASRSATRFPRSCWRALRSSFRRSFR